MMTATASKNATIVIGQRVYSGLYGGRYGTIFAIHGEQNPSSIRDYTIMVTGGRAELDIVFDNGTITKKVPECIVRGVQWKIFDVVLNTEAIQEKLTFAAAEEIRRNEAEAQRKAAIKAEEERVKQAYPYLVPGDAAIKNIRRALKHNFPGIKFSVTQPRGYGIVIKWTCGPAYDSVKAIVERHDDHRFNDLSDCNMWIDDNAFANVFGGEQYISCSRNYGTYDSKALEAAIQANRTTPLDRYLLDKVIHRVLSKSNLGDNLNGIREIDGIRCGSTEDFFEAY